MQEIGRQVRQSAGVVEQTGLRTEKSVSEIESLAAATQRIDGVVNLIQAIAALPKPTHPLFISKVNTGVQVAMVGYVLARRGLGAEAGPEAGRVPSADGAPGSRPGLRGVGEWRRIWRSPGADAPGRSGEGRHLDELRG